MHRVRFGVAVVVVLWCSGCGNDAVSPEPPSDAPAVTDDMVLLQDSENAVTESSLLEFGAPVRGLPADLLARFEAGEEEFAEEESAENGLGPVFNDVSCVACHMQGGTGGAGTLVETRFGKLSADGSFDPLAHYGGSLIQSQGITNGDCSQAAEYVPAEANVVAGRQTTALFGLGLLEAIPDIALRVLADPNDRNHDGISGRPNMVMNPATNRLAIGRFGWKAQVPSVLVFSGDAYLNEMGITSISFPTENAPMGVAPDCDDGVIGPGVEDVDDDGNGVSDGVEGFTDFMRMLAPPPAAGPPTPAAWRGSRTFVVAQCARCHTPSFVTGPVRGIAALSHRRIYPFSDLLLHDMGLLGDGIEQGQAKGREMRTAPLWGLRVGGPYLHDGRAATIEDAIRAHDGEGARSRAAFERLGPQQRSDLLAFLGFI